MFQFIQFLANTNPSCSTSFLGLKAWYAYLPLKAYPTCTVKQFSLTGSNSVIVPILLAIVDDLLFIAGLIAVIYVIVGGVKYGTSQGNPDATSKAQATIISALVGLVIAIIATAIVSFIGNHIGAGLSTGS